MSDIRRRQKTLNVEIDGYIFNPQSTNLKSIKSTERKRERLLFAALTARLMGSKDYSKEREREKERDDRESRMEFEFKFKGPSSSRRGKN